MESIIPMDLLAEIAANKAQLKIPTKFTVNDLTNVFNEIGNEVGIEIKSTTTSGRVIYSAWNREYIETRKDFTLESAFELAKTIYGDYFTDFDTEPLWHLRFWDVMQKFVRTLLRNTRFLTKKQKDYLNRSLCNVRIIDDLLGAATCRENKVIEDEVITNILTIDVLETVTKELGYECNYEVLKEDNEYIPKYLRKFKVRIVG